ncbi:hypothetical protein [Actinoplanes aureus]|uniref:Uncharacterized protein n=1 Tax=Actinoplanes aureus TaxID=2792083 RepID=A0A931CD70_9ACTN|nr:hypothetical protein [Actinoplanes aureus]MBG0565802.1 hypothetical protein [Actinoplanes aureus]
MIDTTGELAWALKALIDDDLTASHWLLSKPGAAAILLSSAATPSPDRDALVRAIGHPAAGSYLRTVLDLLRERGPASWRPDRVAELSRATGLTRAESTLLLAGLPLRDWNVPDFLDESQRGILALTAREAEIARMELHTVPVAHRIELLDAARPGDPAELWECGPDVDRLATAWIALQGLRTPVPEDLLAELGEVMGFPTDLLRTFTAPAPGDWLHTDGECRIEGGTVLTEAPSGGEPFSQRHLPSAATGLAWLAYHLPGGDPVRANLGLVYRLIRERLRNPGLLVGAAWLEQEQVPKALPPSIVAGYSPSPGVKSYHYRPAFLTGPDDPALDVLPDHNPLMLRQMLDPAFERMITSLEAAEGFAQNPLLSAPDAVERLAARFGLASQAASLYLQLLALPDPTDRNVHRWNGWSPAQIAELSAALLEKDLVVEATHAAAGRAYFVPGPWLERRFVPAFEAWKSVLYGFTPDQDPPYRWTLVSRPVAEVFQHAAERVLTGDIPGKAANPPHTEPWPYQTKLQRFADPAEWEIMRDAEQAFDDEMRRR